MTRSHLRRPGPLLGFAAMVGLLCVITRRIGDGDFFWHLRLARWMVDNGSLPTHDLFTYTVPNNIWIAHEYLTDLITYGLWRLGGMAAVSVVFAGVIWLGFWLLWARMRRAAVPALIAGGVAALGALAGVAVWGPRPQMVSFAFMCLTLYWLDRFLREGHRGIYALPAVMVVWANLHGGFIFGPFFVGLALGVCAVHALVNPERAANLRRVRVLGFILAGCLIAGLLTPHGVDLYSYIARTQFSGQQQSFIGEWKSPDFHRLDTKAMELMMILLVAGMAIRRPSLWEFALVAVGMVLALQSIRHTIVFVAATAPVLAVSAQAAWLAVRPRLPAWRASWSARSSTVAATLALLVVTAGTGIFVTRTLKAQTEATSANYPVAAADWLVAHPQMGTHMYNAYAWGGYLIDRFYPDPNRRVFSFSEAELMGDPLLQEVADIEASKPNWKMILAKYDINYVIEPPDTPLVQALSVDPGWSTVYDDGFAVIVLRNR